MIIHDSSIFIIYKVYKAWLWGSYKAHLGVSSTSIVQSEAWVACLIEHISWSRGIRFVFFQYWYCLVSLRNLECSWNVQSVAETVSWWSGKKWCTSHVPCPWDSQSGLVASYHCKGPKGSSVTSWLSGLLKTYQQIKQLHFTLPKLPPMTTEDGHLGDLWTCLDRNTVAF